MGWVGRLGERPINPQLSLGRANVGRKFWKLRGFVGKAPGPQPHRHAAFLEPMIFATYWFLAFAILFFPIFWLCPKPALRLCLLVRLPAVFRTPLLITLGP